MTAVCRLLLAYRLCRYLDTGYTDPYRPGIQVIQNWYTVYTDQVYRLYRPGIQVIQATQYTVFTEYTDWYTDVNVVCIQTGIQVYR